MEEHGLDLCGEVWERANKCDERGNEALVSMKFS